MMSVVAAPCVDMVTAHLFLSVLLVSGALDACPSRNHLTVVAPQTMEALSGSCLQIPCTFTTSGSKSFDGRRKTFGIWYKDDYRKKDNLVFNSNGKVKIYPMNFLGNLKKKNCTTLFDNLTTRYTDRYYLRVENKPYRATAICDPLQIRITDSPPRPTIDISGDVKDLKEEESVTVTCSAPTSCPRLPPRLTWSLQDARSQTVENSDGTLTTKIQTTITLTDAHDGNIISCSASYPVDGGEQEKTSVAEVTLSVSYAPKNTSISISPSGLVSAGSRVNLSCSSRAKPPISSFTWFKSSKDGATRVSEGHFYSFNVTDGGAYYCVAANDLGNQTSPQVDLMVEGEEQLSLLGPIVGGTIGIILILVCLAAILWCLKSTRSSSHQTQSVILEEPARQAESEEVHYGEIDFSKDRPAPPSDPDDTLQTDVVYSNVKVCKTGNRVAQTDDGLETVYAQVMNKSAQ